jgi:hypothetical protein
MAILVVAGLLVAGSGLVFWATNGDGESAAGGGAPSSGDAALAAASDRSTPAPTASAAATVKSAVSLTATTTASPTPAPADRATLSVTALADAQMQVVVDSATVFAGTMRAGEHSTWEGSRRVQISTGNAKNIEVTVNGYVLGPLSAAIGHPGWNTVDWGWAAGWRP